MLLNYHFHLYNKFFLLCSFFFLDIISILFIQLSQHLLFINIVPVLFVVNTAKFISFSFFCFGNLNNASTSACIVPCFCVVSYLFIPAL